MVISIYRHEDNPMNANAKETKAANIGESEPAKKDSIGKSGAPKRRIIVRTGKGSCTICN